MFFILFLQNDTVKKRMCVAIYITNKPSTDKPNNYAP